MDMRHPVKPWLGWNCPLRPSRQADLLTCLVFISYLGDAYQTQPQTWPGLGLRCLSDCSSLGWSTEDIFVPWGLSIEATTKTTANKLHVHQNRSCCWLTCLSLAFLQGGVKGGLSTWADEQCWERITLSLHFILTKLRVYTSSHNWSNDTWSCKVFRRVTVTLKILMQSNNRGVV